VRTVIRVVALVSAAVAACSAGVPTADVPTDAALVLWNGTLIDGTGEAPIRDGVLAIGSDGSIVAVGRRGGREFPEGATVVDVQGATILPGFIDAHVHNAFSARSLAAWAQAGVTTVRDEAINSGTALDGSLLAQRAAWSEPQYSRLLSAGWIISPPGGYGRLQVSSAAEARQAVADEIALGVDLIKVAVEDGTAGRTDLPVLSTEVLAAAVAAAHERGKRVSAHVTDARFLQAVVDAGVDDVAHVTWDAVSDATYRRMIGRHIPMVPTLTVLEPYGALPTAQSNLRRFVALGGTVALGDDFGGVPQSVSPHFQLGMPMPEILWMAEAGMTPMQIIVAATRNAASVCGLGAELGTLEIGKTADVLVVNGDPLQDLNVLTNVRLVIHRGVVIRD